MVISGVYGDGIVTVGSAKVDRLVITTSGLVWGTPRVARTRGIISWPADV